MSWSDLQALTWPQVMLELGLGDSAEDLVEDKRARTMIAKVQAIAADLGLMPAGLAAKGAEFVVEQIRQRAKPTALQLALGQPANTAAYAPELIALLLEEPEFRP